MAKQRRAKKPHPSPSNQCPYCDRHLRKSTLEKHISWHLSLAQDAQKQTSSPRKKEPIAKRSPSKINKQSHVETISLDCTNDVVTSEKNFTQSQETKDANFQTNLLNGLLPPLKSHNSSFFAASQEELNVFCKSIISKTWHVFGTSPFYKLQKDEDSLVNYGNMLTLFLEEKSDLAALLSSKEDHLKATFQYYSFKGKDQLENIEITVTSVSSSGATSKLLFIGHLCLLSSTLITRLSLRKDYEYLPLALIKGIHPCQKHVIDFLETTFVCKFLRMGFSSLILKMIFLNFIKWVGFCEDLSQEIGSLVYKVTSTKNINNIKFGLDIGSLSRIAKRVLNADSKTLSIQEINEFFGALENHFKVQLNIDLKKHSFLNGICFPRVLINADGRIKIMEINVLIPLLITIQDVVLYSLVHEEGIQTV